MPRVNPIMQQNMIGAYGPWAAGLTAGRLPALSFRREEFQDLEAWRAAARQRVLERMAPPATAAPSQVETIQTGQYDGLAFQRLRWQLPYGPATEAVVLKPLDTSGPLPGVLALHCHGGRKCWGWKKVARIADPPPPVRAHQERYYGGRAWANELARRGYVVLAHDTFAFASRKVRIADCHPAVRGQGDAVADGDDTAAEQVEAYDRFAAGHEHIMAKSLFCAGTTWPGVFWSEDRIALDILARRQDVDAERLGCGGLSGGGLRTCLLAGLDERIACAVAVGFMSTWKDFLLYKAFTHTWMLYIPLLPNELDFPEILGLRAPAPTMVQNTTEDQLFTLDAVHESKRMLEAIFAKAGRPERLAFNLYPGPHKFDAAMQEDAFEWFDRWLKR